MVKQDAQWTGWQRSACRSPGNQSSGILTLTWNRKIKTSNYFLFFFFSFCNGYFLNIRWEGSVMSVIAWQFTKTLNILLIWLSDIGLWVWGGCLPWQVLLKAEPVLVHINNCDFDRVNLLESNHFSVRNCFNREAAESMGEGIIHEC